MNATVNKFKLVWDKFMPEMHSKGSSVTHKKSSATHANKFAGSTVVRTQAETRNQISN